MIKISAGDFSFPNEEWEFISDEVKDLISKMLVVDPKERSIAEELLKHSWFTTSKKAKKNMN